MERLVLSKNNVYKKTAGIMSLFVLVVACLSIKDSIFKGDAPADVGTYVAVFLGLFVWSFLVLRMVLYAYPRYIEKLPDGRYEVKTVWFKHTVFQDELKFGLSSYKKRFVKYDYHFEYVVVPYTLLMGRVRFVFEKDVSAFEDDATITISDPMKIRDNGKIACVIGRQYMYVGKGNPLDFFKDNRPPKTGKKVKPSVPRYVPPEMDNPYGISLPEE